ncbi:MAG: hypothetical protein Q8L81_13805 [Bacteroidota bacterium]|nr:hypothetical protein [Bacteroidota bacterium]
MENKIIKPMLIIASLTIGLGLTSCKKECLDDLKKELKKESLNCDPSSSDTLSNHAVKK